MNKPANRGIILSPIETTVVRRPGEVLNTHMQDWIYASLETSEILARVAAAVGYELSDNDVSAFTGWIEDERLLAEGFRLRHELDRQPPAPLEIDLSRPVDDIAAARVAMKAAGIVQPEQGEQ